MEKSLFNRVKKSSAFSRFDLILYAVAVLLTITAFLVVFLGATNEITGFDVSYKNQKIITYDFKTNTYSVLSDCVNVSSNDNEITFTITTEGNNVNAVLVNVNEKSVFMKESNCKNGDCLSFKPINVDGKNSLIFCVNHDIKISATGNQYSPPVSGE